METALGGLPDDSAKMVWSRGCIAHLAPEPLKRNEISGTLADAIRQFAAAESAALRRILQGNSCSVPAGALDPAIFVFI
jgi:hypothetical protein